MAGKGQAIRQDAADDHVHHTSEDRLQIHDLLAALLHCLGIDHQRPTVRFAGHDMRLTDAEGEMFQDIPA